MSIPEFVELLGVMNETHTKKNEDYANQAKQFENFDRQAEVSSWFRHDIDKTFAGLIGLKLARLATLLGKEGDPNFESIQDTFLDLANYSVLWAAWHKRYDEPSRGNQINPEQIDAIGQVEYRRSGIPSLDKGSIRPLR